jgi:hypothetical protein
VEEILTGKETVPPGAPDAAPIFKMTLWLNAVAEAMKIATIIELGAVKSFIETPSLNRAGVFFLSSAHRGRAGYAYLFARGGGALLGTTNGERLSDAEFRTTSTGSPYSI